jgi:hypothetical protein
MKAKCSTICLAICLASTLTHLNQGLAVSFTDGFEGQSLDPFWVPNLTGGSVLFPATAQAHGGAQSVKLSVSGGMESHLFLDHVMPALSYGTVSVWVYDPTPGQFGNFFGLYLESSTNILDLQTFDYEGSEYHYQLSGVSYPTGVPRTKAWHQFSIQSTAEAVSFSIDGITVYTGPGGIPFDLIRLGVYGSVAASSPYFDDFQVSATPAEAPRVAIRVSQIEVCWNSLTNNLYQVQYRSDLTTNTWVDLGAPIQGTGRQDCITDAVVGLSRFYRVLALP